MVMSGSDAYRVMFEAFDDYDGGKLETVRMGDARNLYVPVPYGTVHMSAGKFFKSGYALLSAIITMGLGQHSTVNFPSRELEDAVLAGYDYETRLTELMQTVEGLTFVSYRVEEEVNLSLENPDLAWLELSETFRKFVDDLAKANVEVRGELTKIIPDTK